MIFQQFYEESLGHASYLLGSEATGEALVLDVRRDVEGYFAAARKHGLRIRWAADTHQHNDYLTGICELPTRGDVELLSSARAQLGYPTRPLADQERVEIGEIVLEAVYTPGHTPEHVAFLVTDRSRGEDPLLLLSGGALLVGDVGRPDLLGGGEAKRHAAQDLCRTLGERVLKLPDHVMVFPTHVKGSLCGGNIGSMLFSTIGYEKRANRLLASIADAQTFTRNCLDLSELPTVPPYWRRMRQQNIDGPAPLGVLAEPPPLAPEQIERLLEDEDVWIVDCRAPEAFGSAHVPRAVNVGSGSSFSTWAGTVLPAGARVILVLDRPSDLWDITWQLLRIGYQLPMGWLAGGMRAWRTAGAPVEQLPQWTVWALADHLRHDRDLTLLDVRQPAEWHAGRVQGALHIPGGELPRRLDEVPDDGPIAVMCGSGYRSSVAASLLSRAGRGEVFNVLGGMAGWANAGFPVEG